VLKLKLKLSTRRYVKVQFLILPMDSDSSAWSILSEMFVKCGSRSGKESAAIGANRCIGVRKIQPRFRKQEPSNYTMVPNHDMMEEPASSQTSTRTSTPEPSPRQTTAAEAKPVQCADKCSCAECLQCKTRLHLAKTRAHSAKTRLDLVLWGAVAPQAEALSLPRKDSVLASVREDSVRLECAQVEHESQFSMLPDMSACTSRA